MKQLNRLIIPILTLNNVIIDRQKNDKIWLCSISVSRLLIERSFTFLSMHTIELELGLNWRVTLYIPQYKSFKPQS